MALSEFKGPKGHWLLGNLKQLRQESVRFYVNLQKEFGDRVAFRVGAVSILLVADHETVSRILTKESSKFIKGKAIWHELDELAGKGLFVAEGANWKRRRKLYAPSFTPAAIEHYSDVITDLCRDRADRMICGETRDIHADMTQLTADIISKCIFDKLPSEIDFDLVGSFDTITTAILDRYLHPPRMPHWLPTRRNLRVRRAVRAMHDAIMEMLDEQLNATEPSNTLLSLLMHSTDEDGVRLNRNELRDEIMNIFVPGHESTALATTWAWYELARNPAIYERLKIEVDTVLAGRPFRIEDMKRLPYTRAVLNESLRKYPPFPMTPRQVNGDFEIDGKKVPKGTTLMISSFVMHRNETYFPDPEEFRPERWLDDLEKDLPRGQYIPFGDGPRICVGAKFALAEGMSILATFTQKLEMGQPQPYEREPRQRLTLRAEGGFPMLIRKRKPGSERRQIDRPQKMIA